MSKPEMPKPGPAQPAPPPQSFTTAAQVGFRQGGPRRLAVAAGIALLALLLLVWLGPQDTGSCAASPITARPANSQDHAQISIDDGADAMHRLPRSLQVPPPPARLEVLPERTDDRATEIVPSARTSTAPLSREPAYPCPAPARSWRAGSARRPA